MNPRVLHYTGNQAAHFALMLYSSKEEGPKEFQSFHQNKIKAPPSHEAVLFLLFPHQKYACTGI
jgi:hypothetical protein